MALRVDRGRTKQESGCKAQDSTEARACSTQILELANIKATILVPDSPKPSGGSHRESAGAAEPGAFHLRRQYNHSGGWLIYRLLGS